jgi:hypothetical protein
VIVSNLEVQFAAQCWPGPNASAGIYEMVSGPAVLSIFLDPANLVLTVPPFPDGPLTTARFLRQLAGAAAQMADDLDPPRHHGGAHRLAGT